MIIMPWKEFQSGRNSLLEEVQVWSARLDLEESSHFIHFLSEGEKVRAFRLKDRNSANRQIISRGILRLLLAGYLDVNPQDLVFENSEFGKPFLSYPADSRIGFNLTHSGNLLLLAFGIEKQVGIDVEKIDHKIDFSAIAKVAFSADERLALSHSTDPINDFYKFWTAKEAVLKASGLGFSYPSNQFSVFISKGKTILSKNTIDFTDGRTCSLSSFSPTPGYFAAVAIM
jgi:4'-phosphopantetheinyl transferase